MTIGDAHLNQDAEPPSTPQPVTTAEPGSAGGQGSRPWRARLRKWLIVGGVGVVVLPTISFVLWAWIALSFSYSTGYRAGYVQKISEKGWVCSTWEGELQMVNIPGAAPERWSFTVRDDIVAAAVRASVGHRVALEYEEHRGVPTSCFGDTRYFVVGVRRIEEP